MQIAPHRPNEIVGVGERDVAFRHLAHDAVHEVDPALPAVEGLPRASQPEVQATLGQVGADVVVDQVVGVATPRIDARSADAVRLCHHRRREPERARMRREVFLRIPQPLEHREIANCDRTRLSARRELFFPSRERSRAPVSPADRRRAAFIRRASDARPPTWASCARREPGRHERSRCRHHRTPHPRGYAHADRKKQIRAVKPDQPGWRQLGDPRIRTHHDEHTHQDNAGDEPPKQVQQRHAVVRTRGSPDPYLVARLMAGSSDRSQLSRMKEPSATRAATLMPFGKRQQAMA